jgi:hypothetical protein
MMCLMHSHEKKVEVVAEAPGGYSKGFRDGWRAASWRAWVMAGTLSGVTTLLICRWVLGGDCHH